MSYAVRSALPRLRCRIASLRPVAAYTYVYSHCGLQAKELAQAADLLRDYPVRFGRADAPALLPADNAIFVYKCGRAAAPAAAAGPRMQRRNDATPQRCNGRDATMQRATDETQQ